MLTPAQRDELLIRIDERLKTIDERLDGGERTLYGNGKPGLVERVQKLEDEHEAQKRHHGNLIIGIGLLVEAAGVVYAIFKHHQ